MERREETGPTRLRSCPHCGARAEPSWRFCSSCNGLLASKRATSSYGQNASQSRVLVSVVLAATIGAVVFGALFAYQSARTWRQGAAAKSDVHSDPLDPYRVNIGKTAFNATNGVEIGRIVDVGWYEAVDQRPSPVYKVQRHGSIRNSPVGNVVARDVPSTEAD